MKVLSEVEVFLKVSPVHIKSIVELPANTLKTTEDNPLDWRRFWDLLITSVHDRSDIEEVKKKI